MASQPRLERQHPFAGVTPAAQPRAAAPGAGGAASASPVAPQFALLHPSGPQRRQRRHSYGVSLVLQAGLWFVVFWAFAPPRTRILPGLNQPWSVTWLTAPTLPPEANPVPPVRARRRVPPAVAKSRMARRLGAARPRRLARGRSLRAPRPVAPAIQPPVFVARSAPVATAPDPVPHRAVIMGALSRSLAPHPPQPAARAAVRVGAFADPPPQPPATVRVAAGPRLGVFGRVQAPRPAAAPPARRPRAEIHLGAFHVAPPAASAGFALAVPARRVDAGVFHAAAAPARPGRVAPAPRAAGDQAPVILFKPEPVYPAAARAKGRQGVVVLRVALTAGGAVRVLAVERGLGRLLDQAARQAAQRIRFRPARRGGRAVDVVVLIRVRFRVAD